MAVRYTYASNGQGMYGIDMATGKEGEKPGFPTPDELWNLTFATANAWRDRRQILFETTICSAEQSRVFQGSRALLFSRKQGNELLKQSCSC